MLHHAHAGRIDGDWFIPSLGSLGVRVAHNGSAQVVWRCPDCSFLSSPIPHHVISARGVQIASLPVVEDYRGMFGRCCVKGCDSTDVELNHFAPRAIFRDQADDWPTGYLCRRHHAEWGERVTPYLNPPRSR